MPNGNAVVAYNDFFHEQSDDALALEHVESLHLGAQALEELAQRVSEPQVGRLIGESGVQ